LSPNRGPHAICHVYAPTQPPTLPPTCPPSPQEAAELMEQCTRLDPEERPSALEVMKRLQVMLVAQRAAARHDATL